jgi:hypothetical protein
LGYEASEWHLGEEQAAAAQQQAPVQQQEKGHKKNKQQPVAAQQAPAQVAAPAASSSPCAWLENLFVQKQAATVDQSRTANNAAAAIEQMVNSGAASRGQFGQITPDRQRLLLS